MKELHLKAGQIIKNDYIAGHEIFSLKIDLPEIAKAALPGQFVMVYLDRGELLLPRPISICDKNPENGTIELVYQAVGKGTEALADKKAGQKIKLLGALGNGFYINHFTPGNLVALVGGGIGTPPLFLLAKELKKIGVKADVFLGFRFVPILVDRFKTVAENVFVATEDGSFGERGYVTEILQNQNKINKYTEILACGPSPMLQALSDFAETEKIPCQVSMEERMACGIGTCVGCVVKVDGTYARICTEGPVFRRA